MPIMNFCPNCGCNLKECSRKTEVEPKAVEDSQLDFDQFKKPKKRQRFKMPIEKAIMELLKRCGTQSLSEIGAQTGGYSPVIRNAALYKMLEKGLIEMEKVGKAKLFALANGK